MTARGIIRCRAFEGGETLCLFIGLSDQTAEGEKFQISKVSSKFPSPLQDLLTNQIPKEFDLHFQVLAISL